MLAELTPRLQTSYMLQFNTLSLKVQVQTLFSVVGDPDVISQ